MRWQSPSTSLPFATLFEKNFERDPFAILLGEDVGHAGGIYAQTRGLQVEFGPERVIDTPAGELGFLGAAVGAALTGIRPVVEISFADFLLVCMDQLVNQASRLRYMSGGQISVPLTVMTFGGAGQSAGPQHSGTYEAWLGSIPGLKVAMPATPWDVKGLLKTAIRSDDPVVVILNKTLLQLRGEVSDDPDHLIPLGRAAIRRPGRDLSLVSWSGSVRAAMDAAHLLAEEEIEAEVIDLRSIQPLDMETVLGSVDRTGRLLVVHDTIEFAGVGAEIAATVSQERFARLKAPPMRLAAAFAPAPFSPVLERAYLPTPDRIAETARKLMS